MEALELTGKLLKIIEDYTTGKISLDNYHKKSADFWMLTLNKGIKSQVKNKLALYHHQLMIRSNDNLIN